VNWPELRIPRS